MIGQISILVMIFVTLVLINPINAEERQCKDRTGSLEYNSENHKDNPESKKGFEKSLKEDSLCKFTEKHDKEQIAGEITNEDKLKKSIPYRTATLEQKECIDHYFKLPDDGQKALQGYEIEYCGWDND
jgi:hypothetical protein